MAAAYGGENSLGAAVRCSQAILSIAKQFGSTQPPMFWKYPKPGPTDSHSSLQIGS